jgi:hypothetical protein
MFTNRKSKTENVEKPKKVADMEKEIGKLGSEHLNAVKELASVKKDIERLPNVSAELQQKESRLVEVNEMVEKEEAKLHSLEQEYSNKTDSLDKSHTKLIMGHNKELKQLEEDINKKKIKIDSLKYFFMFNISYIPYFLTTTIIDNTAPIIIIIPINENIVFAVLPKLLGRSPYITDTCVANKPQEILCDVVDAEVNSVALTDALFWNVPNSTPEQFVMFTVYHM